MINVTGSHKMALKSIFDNFHFFAPKQSTNIDLQNDTLFTTVFQKLSEQQQFKVTTCKKHKIEKTAVFQKSLCLLIKSLATATNYHGRMMNFCTHAVDKILHKI